MKRVLLMAALAVLLVPGAAMADTVVNFAGTGGYTGNTSMTFGAVTAYGWVLNTGSGAFDPAVLFQRNDPGDMGLGVCSEGESNCNTGGGDVNEISQLSNQELLSLGIDSGASWVSVTLSSLDTNNGGTPERGYMVACQVGPDPNTVDLTTCATLWLFEGTTPVEQTFLIPAGYQDSSWGLFFVPDDWVNGTNFNNDFLVNSVVINTPEPATLGLLGMGLAGLGLALKRRKKA